MRLMKSMLGSPWRPGSRHSPPVVSRTSIHTKPRRRNRRCDATPVAGLPAGPAAVYRSVRRPGAADDRPDPAGIQASDQRSTAAGRSGPHVCKTPPATGSRDDVRVARDPRTVVVDREPNASGLGAQLDARGCNRRMTGDVFEGELHDPKGCRLHSPGGRSPESTRPGASVGSSSTSMLTRMAERSSVRSASHSIAGRSRARRGRRNADRTRDRPPRPTRRAMRWRAAPSTHLLRLAQGATHRPGRRQRGAPSRSASARCPRPVAPAARPGQFVDEDPDAALARPTDAARGPPDASWRSARRCLVRRPSRPAGRR